MHKIRYELNAHMTGMNSSEHVANFIMYLFYVRIPASHFAAPFALPLLFTLNVAVVAAAVSAQSARLFTFPFGKVSQ